MTEQDLRKANELGTKIFNLSRFIDSLKSNRHIQIFKKPKRAGVLISDYMQKYKYYELDNEQRYKLIAMLEEDLDNYKKQLEEI